MNNSGKILKIFKHLYNYSKPAKQTPLGRWNINDNSFIKANQANLDSCCCSYSIYNETRLKKSSK